MRTPPKLPRDSRSIVELLALRAMHTGGRTAYRFLEYHAPAEGYDPGLNDQGFETSSVALTYADMHNRAMAVAGWLQTCDFRNGQSISGQRVLLVFPPGLDYLAGYFGCLYAGAIAVPAYPPRRNRRADRLRSIVRDAGLSLVLAPAALIESLRETIDADEVLRSLHWQAIESIPDSNAGVWEDPQVDRETIAFLQYTSGSTGDPKGVMVTHGNLLHNQSLIRTHFGTQRASSKSAPIELQWDLPEELTETLIGWLPLHHDMGLIGNALHPLYCGGKLVFMAPIDFLQKPIRWLQAISTHGATISGGPNFAYRLCADEIDLEHCQSIDLSKWKLAFNGAEPIDANVLRYFTEKFTPLGFRYSSFTPCYGMAETTLLISSSICGDEPIISDDQSGTLGCGQIIPDQMDARIVDPESFKENADGVEGEIWLAGDSVAAGYWNRPEQTAETFAAKIVGVPHKRYLRTGDLGFVRNNEIFVTGRLKDLIIIRGTNHYPQDIERTAEQSHSALQIGGGAAFSIRLDGEEQVSLVQEVRRTAIRSLDSDEVIAAIQRSVLEAHDLRLGAVTLIRPGQLPKTTSGKVQRGEAKRMFLHEEYKALASWNLTDSSSANSTNNTIHQDHSASHYGTAPEMGFATAGISDSQRHLRIWLATRIAARVKTTPEKLDINQPFSSFGLDSLSAVRLAGEISDYLGRSIPPTLAYEYPTIALLAQHLSGETKGEQSDSHEGFATDSAPCLEPMAVVGIGCRLPGANSADEFWSLLRNGTCAIGTCSDLDSGRELKFIGNVPDRAGFIQAVDQFDANFFGINPKEADSIDPQQRLLLEVTWQAFEDAGIPLETLSGKSVGVFVGAGNNDYSRLAAAQLMGAADNCSGNGYGATGNSLAMASNRISYTFDFRGPSLTIDTACSSSLVAVHQAIRSLRNGECGIAVVGGVNLMLSDDTTAALTSAGMLSPSGVCRAFAEGADGFVRGEGCGVIVLKPLSSAREDNNRIYAVLRGSAINQDGRTNGLTAPNRQAQEALIRSAMIDARVPPKSISYVEAHGTGTELGDPIEMRAIRAALIDSVPERSDENPLYVGAVKTNIGHLEAAAGIAGLIKVCLSLWHREVVPTLNFESPSPYIDFTGVVVARTAMPWPVKSDNNAVGFAGVSSFGFGGANAHVILEGSVKSEAKVPPADLPQAHLITCSARSQNSLQRLIEQTHAIVESATASASDSLSNIAYSLATGRSHHRYRAALVRLDASSNDSSDRRTIRDWIEGSPAGDLQTAWLFTGQGGAFPEAGKQLYKYNQSFRSFFDIADQSCQKWAGLDLKDLLWKDGGNWLDVRIQPAIFAMQWALAKTYFSAGVAPSLLIGHSLGEYAAACVANVFSFEDGLRIVAKRAELTGAMQIRGGMLAVFADEATVSRYLRQSQCDADIAAINGPRQTVLAGLTESLERIAEELKLQGYTTRFMQTTHGFHSRLVDPICDDFETYVSSIPMSKPQVAWISSHTGELLVDDQLSRVATPGYWRANLRNAVRFYDALLALQQWVQQTAGPELSEVNNFLCIEVGVGSTLSSIVRSAKLGLKAVPGLGSQDSEYQSYLENLARIYVAGGNLNWPEALGYTGHRVAVPTYPFERERYWYGEHTGGLRSATPSSSESVGTKIGVDSFTMLGQPLALATDEIVYEFRLDPNSYLSDHVVAGAIVFPAAAILTLADSARVKLDQSLGLRYVADLEILSPIVIDIKQKKQCQLLIKRTEKSWTGRLTSLASGVWQTHATWTYGRNRQIKNSSTQDFATAALENESAEFDAFEFYERFQAAGLTYGPAFRGVLSVSKTQGGAEGICRLPMFDRRGSHIESVGSERSLHPALLDACLQVIIAAEGNWGDRAWLPVGCRQFRNLATAQHGEDVHVTASVYATSDAISDDAIDHRFADLLIKNNAGVLLAEIVGLKLRATTSADPNNLIFEEKWVPKIRQREVSGAFAGEDAPNFREAFSIAATASSFNESRLAKVLDELEKLSNEGAVFILQQLGFEFRKGIKLNPLQLQNDFGIVPQHQRLFKRILDILVSQHILAASDDDLIVRVDVAPVCLEESFIASRKRYPEGVNEFDLLQRCLTHAASCLTEGTDPLPLLFPSDGSATAAAVYRDSEGGRLMNRLVGAAIDELVSKLPSGRGIRILEIGGGTGATTETVLERLPKGRARYTFTDIASSFLSAARERFQAHRNIDYQILDIERAPDPNLEGAFDIIIASNVLHATADLTVSVANAKKLLAGSGFFVLVEGTCPIAWMDLTFGLTSGWWRFEDTKLRPDYPLISVDDWKSLLGQQGFGATYCISPTLDASNDRKAANSVIIAQNGNTTLDSSEIKHDRTICLIGDTKNQLVKNLTTELQQLVRAVTPCDWQIAFEKISDVMHDIVLVLPSGLEGADENWAEATANLSITLLEHLKRIQANISTQDLIANDPPRLWLISSGAHANLRKDKIQPSHAAAMGLWRTLSLEQPDWKLFSVDVDPDATPQQQSEIVVDEIIAGGLESEPEVAFSNGSRFVRRLDSLRLNPSKQYERNSILRIKERGALTGLTLVSGTRRAPSEFEVEIEVHAAGLNFRDVLNALDLYPDRLPLGAECVGIVKRVGSEVNSVHVGQRVAALTNESFADFVTVPCKAVVPIPEELSWAEAATIPVAYLTAAVALLDLAELRADETVLIHSAAGGVGMAAVAIANAIGAQVIGTASTAKHELLRSRGVQHVFNSRNQGFADEILRYTEGRGVDVILNSLDESFVDANLRLLSKNGRYVDITLPKESVRRQVADHKENCQYYALDLSKLIANYPHDMIDRLRDIYIGVSDGRYQSLPAKEFDLTDYATAFRELRDGTSTGKLLICPRIHADSNAQQSTSSSSNQNGWQVITGGLGGLGLQLARDLIVEGCTRIALVARRRPSLEEQSWIDAISSDKSIVTVLEADVSDYQAMEVVMSKLRQDGGIINAVYHLAGRLDDASIPRQTTQKIQSVFEAKVRGTWNLHKLTLHDPIERFILYSSASAVFGSPGQSNHSAANAFMDAFAGLRRTMGLPALSINWGPWSKIGAAASLKVDQRSDLSGVGMLEPSEGNTIAGLLRTAHAEELPVSVAALRLELEALPRQLAEHPLLESLLSDDRTRIAGHSSDSGQLLDSLSTASEEERPGIISLHLQHAVACTLGLKDHTQIAVDRPFFEMGMDSLTSLDLVNSLKNSIGVTVSTNEIFNFPTIRKLGPRLLDLLRSQLASSCVDDTIAVATKEPSVVDQSEVDDEQGWKEPSGNADEIAALLNEIGDLTNEFEQWEASR